MRAFEGGMVRENLGPVSPLSLAAHALAPVDGAVAREARRFAGRYVAGLGKSCMPEASGSMPPLPLSPSGIDRGDRISNISDHVQPCREALWIIIVDVLPHRR